jgi:predicted Ser/Thr protein kinase
MIGRTIGHYRILERLGRGGSGTVYRAVDETLDREVAIKVLNPDLADAEAMRRFRSEATILAKLNHPAIATIYDLFQSEADLLMVMEFVRGETLDAVSDRLGPLPPDRAASFVERILSALAHAHRAGVVHRDMKPANVMVTDTGAVKLMDFGIARVRGAERVTIGMLGTPAYMAPEQVLSQNVDGRTDLYAVGAIFYRLLTAALPFEAETPIATLQRQLSDPPTPLASHRDDLPDWCEAIMQRALAKAPTDRFQTADEFREAVTRAAGLVTTTDLAPVCAVTASAGLDTHPQRLPTPTLVLSSADAGRPAALSSPSAIAPANGSARGTWFAAGESAHAWFTEQGLPILRRYTHGAGFALAVLAASLALFAFVALWRPATAARTAATRPADPPQKAAVKPTPGRVVFRTEVLVGTGRQQRERDARLALADGRVTVIIDDDRRPLHSVPFERVTSISYSHSRDPMWRSPTGPARVTRTDGGVLGALGIVVDRHWISLGTNTTDRFVVLRVSDTQVRPVLSALEERTGLTTQRLAERKRKDEW